MTARRPTSRVHRTGPQVQPVRKLNVGMKGNKGNKGNAIRQPRPAHIGKVV